MAGYGGGVTRRRIALADVSPALGEIEALAPRLYIESAGGEYGTTALVWLDPEDWEKPARAIRAALLAHAEDSFDALTAAGWRLIGHPVMDFSGGNEISLRVRFHVRRDA